MAAGLAAWSVATALLAAAHLTPNPVAALGVARALFGLASAVALPAGARAGEEGEAGQAVARLGRSTAHPLRRGAVQTAVTHSGSSQQVKRAQVTIPAAPARSHRHCLGVRT